MRKLQIKGEKIKCMSSSTKTLSSTSSVYWMGGQSISSFVQMHVKKLISIIQFYTDIYWETNVKFHKQDAPLEVGVSTYAVYLTMPIKINCSPTVCQKHFFNILLRIFEFFIPHEYTTMRRMSNPCSKWQIPVCAWINPQSCVFSA